MGEIVIASNEQADGEVNSRTTADGTSSGSPSTTTTSTTRTTGSGDRGTGRGDRGTGTGDTTTEKEKLSGLALLTEEEKERYAGADDKERKRILKNARRRQRYHDNKAESGQTSRPRKVNRKQETIAPTAPPVDKTTINMMLASVFSVIASRPNCEHWLLSEAEINSISDPLSKMLSESQAFANMGQYSNQIALVMACATVFLPRLFVTVQKQKEVKKYERTGQHTDTNPRPAKPSANTGKTQTSNSGDNRAHERNTSTNGANNVDNVPWYGSAIC